VRLVCTFFDYLVPSSSTGVPGTRTLVPGSSWNMGTVLLQVGVLAT